MTHTLPNLVYCLFGYPNIWPVRLDFAKKPDNEHEKAGAELCQAQVKLGLSVSSLNLTSNLFLQVQMFAFNVFQRVSGHLTGGRVRQLRLDRNSDNRANSAQFQLKLPTGAELGN